MFGLIGVQTLLTTIIRNLAQAYTYTDDIKYGRAGAIIFDRIADFYPDYDTKKYYGDFYDEAHAIQKKYLTELKGDVSWFCKKFDYRYDQEPWYDSKDAVERAMKFIRGDLHKPPQKKKPLYKRQRFI